MLEMKPRDPEAPIDMGTIGTETYDNGFGVSVIRNPYSYGGDQGLYELAVITKDGLHYNNMVAKGDVRGYLTEEEVEALILEVKMFDNYDLNNKDMYGVQDEKE